MTFLRKIVFLMILACMSSLARAQESLVRELNNGYVQKLVDTARKYYPKNKTFDHRIGIANETLKKANLSWFDVLTFSLSYSPNNATNANNVSLTGLQLGVYFNVGNLISKPNNIKIAKEEVAIAELNKQEYALNLEAEVKTRYYKYLQYNTLVKVQNQRMNDWDLFAKQAKYKFEKGEATFESYSSALVTLAEQKQLFIEAEGSMLIAKAYLEEIVSKKLEEIH